jgi:hypothetical protein
LLPRGVFPDAAAAADDDSLRGAGSSQRHTSTEYDLRTCVSGCTTVHTWWPSALISARKPGPRAGSFRPEEDAAEDAARAEDEDENEGRAPVGSRTASSTMASGGRTRTTTSTAMGE